MTRVEALCGGASYEALILYETRAEIEDTGRKNRKCQYRDAQTGLYPFVRLIEHSAAQYSCAGNFVSSIEADLKRKIEKREKSLKDWAPASHGTALKTIENFRADARYCGDGTRIDLAYAIYAVAHGVRVEDVSAAIRSRDLTHKGPEKRQEEYVDRTIRKAVSATDRSYAGRCR